MSEAAIASAPSVSVIVVSHGRPQDLALCLAALRRQRHAQFEVIVVADQLPPVPPPDIPYRAIPFAKRNVAAARNLGLRAARGTVAAFLDDDAVPEFDWLCQLTAPFSNPRIGAVGGWVRGARGLAWQTQSVLVDREGWDHPLPLPNPTPHVVPTMPDRVLKTTGTNCAFRIAALAPLGGFDEAFAYFLEETDANMRLARAGWLLAAAPGAEVHHRTAPSALRSHLRVPRSLAEIGFSRGVFLSKHALDLEFPTALRRFSDDQWHRLDRFVALGLLTGTARDALLEGFQTGMARGYIAPSAPIIPLAHRPGEIPRDTRRAHRPRLWHTVRASAESAAREGAEVTYLTRRGHRARATFSLDGYWTHSVAPGLQASALIRKELSRIAPRRGPWLDPGSDAR